MTQQALRELVELAERMESTDERTSDASWVELGEAALNALPHLKALLGEQREAQGVADAKEALKALLVSYLRIVHEINGEHYDPEKEADVIRARKILEPCKTCGGTGQIGYSYEAPSRCPSCDGPEPVYYTAPPLSEPDK